jgi:hypothetical protein
MRYARDSTLLPFHFLCGRPSFPAEGHLESGVKESADENAEISAAPSVHPRYCAVAVIAPAEPPFHIGGIGKIFYFAESLYLLTSFSGMR